MTYDEQLAQRIRQYFSSNHEIVEKPMFGGLAFLVGGHMCVGTNDRRLMARVGPRHYDRALKEMYTTIMVCLRGTGGDHHRSRALSMDPPLREFCPQPAAEIKPN
jgi:TfoX/Sxy family transcriptional regulator of competence genes